MRDGSLIPRFGRARRDPQLAVLEGFHAVKHALRFGAELLELVTRDAGELERLADSLAPDVRAPLVSLTHAVQVEVFDQLAPLAPSTGVIALARRPEVHLDNVLADARPAPLLLLEDPRDLGNMGACVRVAAAADAAGVLSSGGHDPWHPDALRGAAGLHFAVPVARVDDVNALAAGGRTLVALDPEGEPLDPRRLPARAILALGSERRGLSAELLGLANVRLGIPMREGISSLNLATSAAAVLFAWRLAAGAPPGPQ